MNENYNDSFSAGPQPPSSFDSVMQIKDWIITMIIMAIPCIGIVMTFVWAFTEGNANRKNFCRASLIFAAICVLLYFLLLAIFGAAMFAFLGNFR